MKLLLPLFCLLWVFYIPCDGATIESDSDCLQFQSRCNFCEPQNINSLKQCNYIDCCCRDIIGDGMIDYFHIMYCKLNGYNKLSISLLMICVIYLLIILAVVSQHYFAELMHEITIYLNLNENVAGPTFVAWGNGAASMSSSIAAIAHGGEQIKLGFGALFGVAVFNILVICSTISWISQKTEINKCFLFRDGAYLCLISLYIIMAYLPGHFTIYTSICLLSLYIGYVLLIWISSKLSTYLMKKRTEISYKETAQRILESKTTNISTHNVIKNKSFSAILSRSRQERIDTVSEISKKSKFLKLIIYTLGIPVVIISILLKLSVPLPNIENWSDFYACLHCITVPLVFYFGFIFNNINIHNQHIFIIITVIIGVILAIMVYIKLRFKQPTSLKTLLQTQRRERRHESTYGTIDTLPVTELSAVKPYKTSSDFDNHSDKIIITDMMNNIINEDDEYLNGDDESNKYIITMDELSRQPVMKGLFLFLSFISLITWIKLISEELVSILTLLGIISEIDLTLLGIFVLSLGNAIPDFMNNISVATKGYTQMAISACFGGSSLQIAIGIAIGTIIVLIRYNHDIIQIKNSKYILIGCLFTNIGTVSYIVIVASCKWKLNRIFAIFAYCCYASFLLINILI